MTPEQARTLIKTIPLAHTDSVHAIARGCAQPFQHSAPYRLRSLTSGPLPDDEWLIWVVCQKAGVLVHYQIFFRLSDIGLTAKTLTRIDGFGQHVIHWVNIPGFVRDLARTYARGRIVK